MTIELLTVPCLADNYAYLVHDPATGQTAAVDVPEAGPLLTALAARGWGLTQILLTHHHDDHIAGVADLVAATGAQVLGAAADAHRLPPLDEGLTEASRPTIGGHAVEVIDVPGHTVGHIAFHIPSARLAFTADSLMAAGCGRLFEGTPGQMWHSLQRLAALAPETLICSGHEYTTANIRFALSLEPDNPKLILRRDKVEAARRMGHATVPSLLSEELATNPFLRAGLPQMKACLGMGDANDLDIFSTIRRRKDTFR